MRDIRKFFELKKTGETVVLIGESSTELRYYYLDKLREQTCACFPCRGAVSRADCFLCAPTPAAKAFYRTHERSVDLAWLMHYAPELLR